MRLLLTASALAFASQLAAQNTTTPAAQAEDPVRVMVGRLSLDRYKETLRGLAQFGDRRQGTSRNRAATDWIEAQLKSYGCTNTERVTYQYTRRQLSERWPQQLDSMRAYAALTPAQRDSVDDRSRAIRDSVARAGRGGRGGGGGGRGGRGANPQKGFRGPTGVNINPFLQPDTALRRINMEPDMPGERQQVFCTKIGKTRPNEMYIIGAHMDGHGFGAAVNDDGSGTALVMELARVFNSPDVETDVSIRFALWNNEETGLNGARAYIEQRQALQGIENPAGSGRYPEPKWLAMVQHDMMMWDHGAPGPDGKVNPTQRREADVNIEFRDTSKFASEASKLAWFFRQMNDRYATDYPATVGDRMSNTDSDPFKDLVPSISLRENERLAHTGSGWNPTWHQPIDVMSTFTDADFKLGLNAAQTTLSAIATLSGAKLRK